MVYRQIDETSPSRPITLHSNSRWGSNPVTTQVVVHSPIAPWALCPTKRASSAGPSAPSSHSAPLTSVEKRDDNPMSDTSAHTSAAGASTSADTDTVGHSAYFIRDPLVQSGFKV